MQIGRDKKFVVIFLFFLFANFTVQANDRDTELNFLRPILARNLLEFGKIEVPALRNLNILSEGANQFLELKMFPGQQHTNNGNRAEISLDFPFRAGETISYQWRFRIPAASETDAPQNRWWILAQWHDQPNPDLGETWQNFPSRSPSISIGYGMLNGRDMISVNYGTLFPTTIELAPIERDKWHTINAKIHWSMQQNGKANFYLDANAMPFARANGPNMHNDFQHYLKLGTYRHPMIKVESQIQIDEITITRLD